MVKTLSCQDGSSGRAMAYHVIGPGFKAFIYFLTRKWPESPTWATKADQLVFVLNGPQKWIHLLLLLMIIVPDRLIWNPFGLLEFSSICSFNQLLTSLSRCSELGIQSYLCHLHDKVRLELWASEIIWRISCWLLPQDGLRHGAPCLRILRGPYETQQV